MEKNFKLLEAVADIAFNVGWMRPNGDFDSRELMYKIVDWAEEFEKKYADVEWNVDLDYIETIDQFAAEKYNEWKTENGVDEL